jgi:hypothetical protein
MTHLEGFGLSRRPETLKIRRQRGGIQGWAKPANLAFVTNYGPGWKRSDVNDADDMCDQLNHSIDNLMMSVDAMRWTPAADESRQAVATTHPTPHAWEPAECKARFDALYESIDAFAGAVDDRIHAFADRIDAAFADPRAADERARSEPSR